MSVATSTSLTHVMRVNRVMRWQIRLHESLGNTCDIDLDFCPDCGDFIADVSHRDWFSN